METLNANFDFQVMLKSCEGKFDTLPIMIYFNAYAMHYDRSPMLIPYSRVRSVCHFKIMIVFQA